MSTKKQREIKSIIEKILLDHVKYSCSTNLYKKYTTDIQEKTLDNMKLRHRLITNIRERETHQAFMYLIENESLEDTLISKLSTLSFIDLIYKDRTPEAIEFAKTYHVDTSVFSLIGYGTETEDNDMCSSIDREEVMSLVNSYLFKKLSGRNESLLHGTVSYYNTLRNKNVN